MPFVLMLTMVAAAVKLDDSVGRPATDDETRAITVKLQYYSYA